MGKDSLRRHKKVRGVIKPLPQHPSNKRGCGGGTNGLLKAPLCCRYLFVGENEVTAVDALVAVHVVRDFLSTACHISRTLVSVTTLPILSSMLVRSCSVYGDQRVPYIG